MKVVVASVMKGKRERGFLPHPDLTTKTRLRLVFPTLVPVRKSRENGV